VGSLLNTVSSFGRTISEENGGLKLVIVFEIVMVKQILFVKWPRHDCLLFKRALYDLPLISRVLAFHEQILLQLTIQKHYQFLAPFSLMFCKRTYCIQ